MKVFKFGGASVKDANAIKNVSAILTRFSGQKILVVVSAMGKTTNKLEEIVAALLAKDQKTFVGLVDELQAFHEEIAAGLFPEKHFQIFEHLADIFTDLRAQIQRDLSENHSFVYDQIVSLGELLSSRIVNAFLLDQGLNSQWLDARTVVRTDNHYQEGQVDWQKTQELCDAKVIPLLERHDILLTQGFIGHTTEGFTTTLGREGSDYTAGIFAFCCAAKEVTIWKDVPGMLNADPKYFADTQLLEEISFKEAIELSYYGASVIHPKTVQPLQQKDIPLFVKSFLDPDAKGTKISSAADRDAQIPSFIVKKDQILLTFSSIDFSFIAEKHLSAIFDQLAQLQVPINIMQNSALNFSILADRKKVKLEAVKLVFEGAFKVKYNEGLELVTIRHYNQATIEQMTASKEIILEQRTRNTARFVLRNLE